MLKKLRHKKTQKRLLILISIIVIPGFLIWGSVSYIRGKQEPTDVGRIFGKTISILDYKDALEAAKNQAIIQFGDNLSEIQKSLNLDALAWERLILLAEAKKHKIKVSDKEVIDLIESYPFFQRKERFDHKLYSEMLRYVFRTQPRIFEEQIRQDLILSRLYKEITDTIKLSEEEIKAEYKKINEQLSLYYIAGLPLSFAKDIIVSNEELKDYFAKNAFEFKQPLSFNIEYITLTYEDKDEETINNKIKTIFLRLNKKEDFNKVAADYGLSVKETGLFPESGPIPGMGWSTQVLSLISKAGVGQYLPAINMDKSYYILRLKERGVPYIPDFENIKDKVKERFIKDKSTEIAKQKIEDAFKILKEAYKRSPNYVDFEKPAKLLGLKSGSTDLFKYGSYIEGIGASDNFWTAAQDLKKDGFSDIIDMGLAGFYIIKLKSRTPIDEKEFEAEKTKFSNALLLLKKQEYFTKFVEDLKRRTQRF